MDSISENNIAALFHFANCTVTIATDGVVCQSPRREPQPGDVVLEHDFIMESDPNNFINERNDFYNFLSHVSPATNSLIVKLMAIGYMLCNRLARGGKRTKMIVCANEDQDAVANGKSLFCEAISKMSRAYAVSIRNLMRNYGDFWMDPGEAAPGVLVIEDANKKVFSRLYSLCSAPWTIYRSCDTPLHVEPEHAPYILTTTSDRVIMATPPVLRHIVVLPFSSFFDPQRRPFEYFGHFMFEEWDAEQWNMFYNLMIYCIREYLYARRTMEDPFAL